MIQLAHTTLLLVHLFKALVLSKLLKKLLLEVLFKTLLFSGALSLKSHLELFGILKLTLSIVPLIVFSLCTGTSSELRLFEVQLVPQILLEFFLSTSLHLLCFKSLKDLVASLFSSVFSGLNLVEALLLLLGVLTHHFVFKGFHLVLTLDKSPFLVNGKNHVSLGLLHLEVLDSGHFSIFVNHSLDDVVHLFFFFHVLLLGFSLQLLMISDLLLDALFVGDAVV